MITIEYTDTFGGEANYCWVKRFFTRKNLSDAQAVRLAKRLVGLTGVRCEKDQYGEGVELRPVGCCTVLFIGWQDDDSPDYGRPALDDELTEGELRGAGLHHSQV